MIHDAEHIYVASILLTHSSTFFHEFRASLFIFGSQL
jgi:hypothetical protein